MPQNIVITGVSRGLGKAMALEFASRGHRIFGGARDTDAISSLSAQLGGDHYFSELDVADESSVQHFSEQTRSRIKAPDVLINAAALINEPAPLWEVPTDEFSQLMNINLTGVHRLISAFTPSMIAAGSGVIINFSSGWGRSTSSDVAPYCATKWGIEGLTQALAQDLPTGLAAVAFNPGVIDTAMLQKCFGEEARHYPEPDEWAKVAVPFLESLDASNNGQALTRPGM
ncbi:SDR family NAD(P)-dependent oxidoreductase [Verrucomicrobiales bacterium]|jgi:NAD(P)-dependent dehydrogenase (short-subunit alcohol dehydrogenase family)|nr:SDR family NAD(P)-dependent oxidoreductase [Verrucomicrobiales bacterium]